MIIMIHVLVHLWDIKTKSIASNIWKQNAGIYKRNKFLKIKKHAQAQKYTFPLIILSLNILAAISGSSCHITVCTSHDE